MSNLVDTILNVLVFAFIALLVWIYIKPVGGSDGSGPKKP